MNKKSQKVKILWKDARLFFYRNTKIGLSQMETEGYIEREQDDYVVVKNINTKNIENGKDYPNGEKPNFFFIPKSFIVSIKNIK